MTPNGCSGGLSFLWRKTTDQRAPFQNCCNQHDLAYGEGGSKEQRRLADAQLFECVAGQGRPVLALLMWMLVRVFGSPYWPGRMRWGRNHKWPHRYK